MADYTEIKDIDRLRTIGANLSAKAEQFNATAAQLTGNITSIAGTDGEVPAAGPDHFGDTFRQSYNGEDAGHKIGPELVDAVVKSPDSLKKLGDGLVQFGTAMQGADMDSAAEIKDTSGGQVETMNMDDAWRMG